MDLLFCLKLCGVAAMGLVAAVAMRRELAACHERVRGMSAWPSWLTFAVSKVSGDDLPAGVMLSAGEERTNKGKHVFGPGEHATVHHEPLEPLSVIAPQSLRGEAAHAITADEWDVRQRTGVIDEEDSYPLEDGAPGVVMYCDVYVDPSFVNFSHVNIFEWLASPTNRQGCYENIFSYPDSMLGHDFSNGAVSNYLENANQVSGHNYVGADRPGAWFSEQTWYTSGSYDLPIPVYWYCRPSSETDLQPQPQLMTTVVQHVSIDTNGTMRVEKFGLGVERSIPHNQ